MSRVTRFSEPKYRTFQAYHLFQSNSPDSLEYDPEFSSDQETRKIQGPSQLNLGKSSKEQIMCSHSPCHYGAEGGESTIMVYTFVDILDGKRVRYLNKAQRAGTTLRRRRKVFFRAMGFVALKAFGGSAARLQQLSR